MARCNDNWKNPAGGLWTAGSNWSTGSPPTADQAACITVALRAPVVLSAAVAARSLTLGGPVGAAELELNGASLTLATTSSVTPSGALVVTGGTSTLELPRPDVLANHGVINIEAEGLNLDGALTNAADGTIDLSDTDGWAGHGSGGTLGVASSGRFTNEGTVWVQENAGIQTASSPGAVIDNAGGLIANAGKVTVGPGATFVEGGGRVIGSDTGNYNLVQVAGGTLDLVGNGASTFQLAGAARVAGTLAPDQVLVTFSSPDLATVGSFINRGLISTQYAGSTISVPGGSTLYNEGIIQSVHGNTLNIAGRMVNTPAGEIDVSGGTFALVHGSVLVNQGSVFVTGASNLGNGNLEVPQGTEFENIGGNITNEGSFTVDSGTFVEVSGREQGLPVDLQNNDILSLQGAGASSFWFRDGGIRGNVASDQSVSITGTVSRPPKFTNFGTLTAKSATIELPPGGTLTNKGILNSPPNTQELVLDGNLVNAPGAVFNLNGAGGYAGNLYMPRPGASFDNQGTLEMATGFIDFEGENETFHNTGTILFGVVGGEWGGFGLHSTIQATAGGMNAVIDGTVVPLYDAGNVPLPETPPAPPWPTTPKTITYELLAGGGGQSGKFDLSCGAAIGANWSLSCPNPHRALGQGGDSGQAILTAGSATTLSPTEATLVSSEPVAGYGRAYTSHFGQPVTLTATVHQQRGPVPTGAVTFYDVVNNVLNQTQGIAVLGTTDLTDVNGLATAKLTTSSLSVGLHDILAYYGGDAHNMASTSKDYTQQIAPDPTQVNIVAGHEPSFGRATTLRADITASRLGVVKPTGDVVFYGQGGGQFLGAVPVSTTPQGVTHAVLTTTGLSPVTDNLVAIYLGDVNYLGATSPSVSYNALPPVTRTSP